MTIAKKTWFSVLLVVGGGLVVGVSSMNGFFPKLEDISDPLGRPSDLSMQVIHSASEFDRISGELVPEHADLATRVQRLHGVSNDLNTLVDGATALPQSTQRVNDRTAALRKVSHPLPSEVGEVTKRTNIATPRVGALNATVGAITGNLDNVHTGLQAAQADLSRLGPRADAIAATLNQISAESARLRPISPILSTVSRLLQPTGLISGQKTTTNLINSVAGK